jgi:diguanylate cyclase (GGDEF)-like protein
LTRSWELPETFYEPIGCHHNPEKMASTRSNIQLLGRILHLSSLFIEVLSGAEKGSKYWLLDHWTNEYGYGETLDGNEVLEAVQQQTVTIFPLFEIDFDEEDNYLNIIETARAEATKLSVDMMKRLQQKNLEIEMLKSQVIRDSMTNLYNYQHFHELLHKEIARSLRYKQPLSVILADIDHFKSINDKFGHLAGDRVIKAVASCLKKSVRESDDVARYGGEEFAIILPETDQTGATEAAGRIRKDIENLEVVFEDNSISFTISLGISSVVELDEIAPDELIKRADIALYRAKEKGRNHYCVYE